MVVTNDVEKNWHNPEMFRSAVTYTVWVIVVAAIAFAAYVLIGDRNIVVASTVPAILLVGGIGAFVKTYRVWRDRGTWPIWQGAGWFLLSLMLVTLSVPGSAITG
jgi:hypothetical protein